MTQNSTNQTLIPHDSSPSSSIIWVPYLSIVCLIAVLLGLAFSFYAHMARVKRRRDNARDYAEKDIDLNRKRLFGMMRVAKPRENQQRHSKSVFDISPNASRKVWTQYPTAYSFDSDYFQDDFGPNQNTCHRNFSSLDSADHLQMAINNNSIWGSKNCHQCNMMNSCKFDKMNPVEAFHCRCSIPIHHHHHCCHHCFCSSRKDNNAKVKRSNSGRKNRCTDHHCQCCCQIPTSNDAKCRVENPKFHQHSDIEIPLQIEHTTHHSNDIQGVGKQGTRQYASSTDSENSSQLPDIEAPLTPHQQILIQRAMLEKTQLQLKNLEFPVNRFLQTSAKDDTCLERRNSAPLSNRRTQSESRLRKSRGSFNASKAKELSCDKNKEKSIQVLDEFVLSNVDNQYLSYNKDNLHQKIVDINHQHTINVTPSDNQTVVEMESQLSEYQKQKQRSKLEDGVNIPKNNIGRPRSSSQRLKGEVNMNFCIEPTDPIETTHTAKHLSRSSAELQRGSSSDKPLLNYVDENREDYSSDKRRKFASKKKKKTFNIFKSKRSATLTEGSSNNSHEQVEGLKVISLSSISKDDSSFDGGVWTSCSSNDSPLQFVKFGKPDKSSENNEMTTHIHFDVETDAV